MPREESAAGFRLLGHDPGAGWGGGSLVAVRKGFAYVGAIGGSGPEGFTVHDVRDPRKPKRIAAVEAPPGIHSHKVRAVGDDLLYVNAERGKGAAGKDARTGALIYDVSRPAEPRQVGFFDLPGNGPHRFGVDNARGLAFFPNEADGWDKRVIWTCDIRDPLRPDVVSVWGLPWQASGVPNPTAPGAPGPMETNVTCHGPPMIRGDRMYCAFWGGGVAIIDCSELTDMSLVGHICWSPPFAGATHTAWPVGERPYLVVTDEARGKQKYWDSQFMWVVDIREETNPIPVATFLPDRATYFDRPGRFGAHNIVEDVRSDGPWANIVFLTYFNAGLRAVDVSDPLQPKELGHYVPAVPNGQEYIQSNDVGTDDEGRLYLIDRAGAGMHILEYTGR